MILYLAGSISLSLSLKNSSTGFAGCVETHQWYEESSNARHNRNREPQRFDYMQELYACVDGLKVSREELIASLILKQFENPRTTQSSCFSHFVAKSFNIRSPLNKMRISGLELQSHSPAYSKAAPPAPCLNCMTPLPCSGSRPAQS